MRGRERLYATAAIWTAFVIVMNNLLDRFIRVSADFSGLWPPLTYYGEIPANNPTVDELNALINQTGIQIVQQVDYIVARHMATYIPAMVLLILMLILAATLSTFFVWRNAYREAAAPARHEKTKGSSRVDLLVNTLDDGELADLRARLAVNHGKAFPLEDGMR